MIHDATVEVTCDGPRCNQSVTVTPRVVYSGIGHTAPVLDDDDEAIGRLIERDHDWLVNGGKQFCCDTCLNA